MGGVIERAGRLGAFLLLWCCVLLAGARADDVAPQSQCPFQIPATAPPFVLDWNVRGLKEGEALRILAIGSSSTAGFGASGTARAYPAQLAARLGPALAPRPVKVVNAG